MAAKPWQKKVSGSWIVIVDATGRIIECATCPCAPSPTATATPTATGTATPTPTTTGFPGDGWYCVKFWAGATCGDLQCQSADCKHIEDEATWDSYDFGTCRTGGATASMYTTDKVRHETEADCTGAGCECE